MALVCCRYTGALEALPGDRETWASFAECCVRSAEVIGQVRAQGSDPGGRKELLEFVSSPRPSVFNCG